MKSSLSVREKTGLSQLQLSQYLGITRTTLSMYEQGHRDLPTAAVIKLGKLEIMIQNEANKTTVRPHEKAQQKKAYLLLDSHCNEMEYQIEQAKRKLALAQKKYNQQNLVAQLLSRLSADTNRIESDAKHRAWLQMMEAETEQALNKQGLDVVAMLQLELAATTHRYEQANLLKKQFI
jgi:transcriptional regulator with XRE-family HTH domain